VFLYLVFGMKAFDDYAELQTQTHIGPALARRAGGGAGDSRMARRAREWPVLTRVSEMPFLAGNEARIADRWRRDVPLDLVRASLRAAESISSCSSTLSATMRWDERWRMRLIERAKAGVTISMVYDDIGSTGLPKAYVRKIAGGRDASVSAFNQRHRFLRVFGPTRINYRTHRKIVVVDGQDAWVGGHNVGVEYLGQDPTSSAVGGIRMCMCAGRPRWLRR
jgi:cardiolipin synthase